MFELILWRHGEGSSFVDDDPVGLLSYIHNYPRLDLKRLVTHPDFRRLDLGDDDFGYTIKKWTDSDA